MKDDKKDEIIEELWQIKDAFSSSCNKDIKKIIEKMNRIAKEQGFLENVGKHYTERDTKSKREKIDAIYESEKTGKPVEIG